MCYAFADCPAVRIIVVGCEWPELRVGVACEKSVAEAPATEREPFDSGSSRADNSGPTSRFALSLNSRSAAHLPLLKLQVESSFVLEAGRSC